VSRTKLLLDVVQDLRSLADSIQTLCDAVTEGEPAEEAKPTAKPKKAKPEKTVSLEEVRAVLADKSQSGLTAEVRELIGKYGAGKLSEVDPANYAALLKDAEGLGNG